MDTIDTSREDSSDQEVIELPEPAVEDLEEEWAALGCDTDHCIWV